VGHSFQYIRNATNGFPARNIFLERVWNLFEMPIDVDMGQPMADADLPRATSLSQNFPNPFNPATRVKFGLKEKGHVSLRIYDVSGRLVRVLIDEILDAGSYEVVWDGTNGEDRSAASGIYFCRMETTDYERTLKMVMLR
jgi:hypothetical protein